jgi:hypothetical protein
LPGPSLAPRCADSARGRASRCGEVPRAPRAERACLDAGALHGRNLAHCGPPGCVHGPGLARTARAEQASLDAGAHHGAKPRAHGPVRAHHGPRRRAPRAEQPHLDAGACTTG